MSADQALYGAGMSFEDDQPRDITGPLSGGDRTFRWVLRGCGIAVLAITGLIGVFLVIEARKALAITGFHFLTTETFNPSAKQFGIASLLPNGIFIAIIALVVAVPVAIGTALFISEYAPAALRRPMIALVDLMAAIPSILYGIWGVAFLEPRVYGTERWMATHLAFIPFFKVPGAHHGQRPDGLHLHGGPGGLAHGHPDRRVHLA